MNWKNKKVLVTGSEGMIGRELCKLLEEKGAEVYGFDNKHSNDFHSENVLYQIDIQILLDKFKPEFLFHLFGIKGNPKMTNERPVDFMYPMIVGDANVIRSAQWYGVKRFLYTSSIAVENLESDFYPAWAKQTAEHLIDAMRIQYPKGTKYCIVRPSNVYGKENLDRDNLMVVSNLIKQCEQGEIILDEKGMEQERDIIHARDVARGMIECMEGIDAYQEHPCNLCSGKLTKIKDIAKEIAKQKNVPIHVMDLKMTLGPEKKGMKINWEFQPQINLKEGIKLCL